LGLFCLLGTNPGGGCRGASEAKAAGRAVTSGVKKYDPFYSALVDYDAEYHAAQNGCSLSTILSDAARAVGNVFVGSSPLLTPEAELAAVIDRVVIGKVADLEGPLAAGERTLFDQLPNQFSEAANSAQNERVLLQEMKSGNPIRDASVDPNTGALANNTGFLAMERGILVREGWNYDPATHLWSPGG
jgi:hypothetical protein